jgi:hypothetical protein
MPLLSLFIEAYNGAKYDFTTKYKNSIYNLLTNLTFLDLRNHQYQEILRQLIMLQNKNVSLYNAQNSPQGWQKSIRVYYTKKLNSTPNWKIKMYKKCTMSFLKLSLLETKINRWQSDLTNIRSSIWIRWVHT